jgi:hypothetical protein
MKNMKVYKTELDAYKDMAKAASDINSQGKTYLEHYELGYVIKEYNVIDGILVFQRYYKGE